METSAKTAMNVNELFLAIGKVSDKTNIRICLMVNILAAKEFCKVDPAKVIDVTDGKSSSKGWCNCCCKN